MYRWFYGGLGIVSRNVGPSKGLLAFTAPLFALHAELRFRV